MRRSPRIQQGNSVCLRHYHQAYEHEEMALCGLLSFNNLFHKVVLRYEECQQVARTWVSATCDVDERLTAVADNMGRGAFSISILKVALEKRGFVLINISKKNTSRELPSSIAWNHRPCVMLCSDRFNSISHAVCICEFGNLHDPDSDTFFSLPNKEPKGSLHEWLKTQELEIQNIYQAAERVSTIQPPIFNETKRTTRIKRKERSRTKRGKKNNVS